MPDDLTPQKMTAAARESRAWRAHDDLMRRWREAPPEPTREAEARELLRIGCALMEKEYLSKDRLRWLERAAAWLRAPYGP